MVRTLENKSQEYKHRRKKMSVECILYHPVMFATVSPFSRQIPRVLLLMMETLERRKKEETPLRTKLWKCSAFSLLRQNHLSSFLCMSSLFLIVKYLHRESMCYLSIVYQMYVKDRKTSPKK